MYRSQRNVWILDFMRKLVFSRAAGLSWSFLSSHFCMKHSASGISGLNSNICDNQSVSELVNVASQHLLNCWIISIRVSVTFTCYIITQSEKQTKCPSLNFSGSSRQLLLAFNSNKAHIVD